MVSNDSRSAIHILSLLMILGVCCFQISMVDVRADDVLRFVEEYPKRPPVTLKKIRALTGVEYGTAEGPSGSTAPHGSFPGHENSGIVKSRQFPDLYWLHNDSGDEPRVYPIHGDGTDYKSARSSERMGVLLGAAINVDWEDITVNESGQLIVCDLGNNRNDRRDLVIYLVPEPAPLAARAAWMTRYFVRYPIKLQSRHRKQTLTLIAKVFSRLATKFICSARTAAIRSPHCIVSISPARIRSTR